MIQHSFKNEYNMYKNTECMECQEINNGIVLPRINSMNGPMCGISSMCDGKNQQEII